MVVKQRLFPLYNLLSKKLEAIYALMGNSSRHTGTASHDAPVSWLDFDDPCCGWWMVVHVLLTKSSWVGIPALWLTPGGGAVVQHCRDPSSKVPACRSTTGRNCWSLI